MARQNIEEDFYALISVARSPLTMKGQGIDLFRYKAKNARRVKVSEHVRTFIYFHPVFQTWDIHEESCGLLIGRGKTETEAIADVKRFFAEANEKMFFAQAAAFGPSKMRPTITFDKAMEHYKAGTHVPKRGNGSN